MKRGRQHWYHCSQKYHGLRWTASRICPPLKGTNEPDTPRLCVAPTVAGCLSARLWSNSIAVYRTAAPRKSVAAKVWDAPITGERWLVPPVSMELVAVIPAEAVRQHMGWLKEHLERAGEAGFNVRLRQYVAAVRMLEAVGPGMVTGFDRRFACLVKEELARRGESV